MISAAELITSIYINPDWPEAYNRCKGTAFQIAKPCFEDRNPLLYYRGSDRGIKDKKFYAETIRKYSSGISEMEDKSIYAYEACFTFRLDASAIRETVVLEGKEIRTADVGGLYVLVLPVTGEFKCELDEIIEGKMFPLSHEHFLVDSLSDLYNDLYHHDSGSFTDFHGTCRMTNSRF